MLAEEFLREARRVVGDGMEAFVAAMAEAPAVSIKMNRRKAIDPAVTEYAGLEPVKWCRSGWYLPERPKFTLNPLLHAGVFYVQDASSMIYETLVSSLLERGLIPRQAVALDMCAAPGGKTTSIINALPDGSTVVANEVMPQRARILAENLLKWGYTDILVTNSPTKVFTHTPEAFDLIAVDAPCSGEGMMRKDEEAVRQWSPRLVEQCAALQRDILADAVAALRPGGVLIYSTCTFNRTEDERNAEWLVAEFGLEPIDPMVDPGWEIGRQVDSAVPALRFMPHLTRGEGLFVAIFRKPGDSPTPTVAKTLSTLRKKAKVILDGIPQSQMKGKVEIPASEGVLATGRQLSYPTCELELETALRYLRHEAIALPSNVARGFVVVTYKGYPLGLVKNIGNRANNLYPSQWRIRNL